MVRDMIENGKRLWLDDGIRRLARRETSIRRSVGLPYAVERAIACRDIE